MFHKMLLSSLSVAWVCFTAHAASDPLETVDVVGSREHLREQIHDFVSSVTRLDGELISRWNKDTPICPMVAADNSAVGEFIRKRLLDIAAQVPIRADTDPKSVRDREREDARICREMGRGRELGEGG